MRHRLSARHKLLMWILCRIHCMAWRFVSFVTFHLYMATFQNTFIPPVRRKLPARSKLLQSQARPHRVPHRAPIELVCSELEVDFASYSRCSCSCWLCSLAETSVPSAGAACFLWVSGDAQRAKKSSTWLWHCCERSVAQGSMRRCFHGFASSSL